MAIVNPIPEEFLDKLDPQFIRVYNKYAASRMRADQVSIEEYRANPLQYTAPIPSGPCPEVESMKIHHVEVFQPPGEIEIQVYKPTKEAISAGGHQTPGNKLPAHINYHGGGWVIGDLKTDESWCRQVCHRVGCIVVDVNYRHGPEFPFPAAIWDAYAALKWVVASAEELGIDPSRISIGGLSAGGHLTAVVTHLARDDPDLLPLKLQILVVPCVDMRWAPIEGSCDPDVVPYKNYIICEAVPCLPLHRIQWFFKHWVGNDPDKRREAVTSPLASPILFPSHANLAPALIQVAEYDILCSEAEAYHAKLVEAKTQSSLKVYKGMCHPFAHLDAELDTAKECVNDAIEALKSAYSS